MTAYEAWVAFWQLELTISVGMLVGVIVLGGLLHFGGMLDERMREGYFDE